MILVEVPAAPIPIQVVWPLQWRFRWNRETGNDKFRAMMKAPNLDTDHIVQLLRKHQRELESVGARHLALFGSFARGTANPNSDMDFAVVYDRKRVKSLLDMGSVAARISAIVGTDRIDVADEETLRAPVKRQFAGEHVRIF